MEEGFKTAAFLVLDRLGFEDEFGVHPVEEYIERATVRPVGQPQSEWIASDTVITSVDGAQSHALVGTKEFIDGVVNQVDRIDIDELERILAGLPDDEPVFIENEQQAVRLDHARYVDRLRRTAREVNRVVCR